MRRRCSRPLVRNFRLHPQVSCLPMLQRAWRRIRWLDGIIRELNSTTFLSTSRYKSGHKYVMWTWDDRCTDVKWDMRRIQMWTHKQFAELLPAGIRFWLLGRRIRSSICQSSLVSGMFSCRLKWVTTCLLWPTQSQHRPPVPTVRGF